MGPQFDYPASPAFIDGIIDAIIGASKPKASVDPGFLRSPANPMPGWRLAKPAPEDTFYRNGLPVSRLIQRIEVDPAYKSSWENNRTYATRYNSPDAGGDSWQRIPGVPPHWYWIMRSRYGTGY